MRRFLPVVILFVFLLQITGCAMRSHVWELEDRVDSLSEENARLRQTLSEMGGDISQQEGFRQDLTRFAATHNAELYAIKTEAQRLSGVIEEIEYTLERDLKTLTNDLADYDRRLSRLETYVGIGAPQQPEETAQRDDSGSVNIEDLGEQELYDAAKRLFDNGDDKAALDGFEMFLKKFPQSELADNSRFWTGEIHFAEAWYEKAIVEYQKVIDDYPEGNKVPSAYLKQGIAFSLIGENDNAVYILKELIRKFPDHNEAKIAERRLAEMGQ